MWKANAVAWFCCGVWNGGDGDVGGGGGGVLCGDGRTCVGSCDGGGDCCVVVVGKVVVVLVRQWCQVGLVLVLKVPVLVWQRPGGWHLWMDNWQSQSVAVLEGDVSV